MAFNMGDKMVTWLIGPVTEGGRINFDFYKIIYKLSKFKACLCGAVEPIITAIINNVREANDWL